MGTFLAIIHAKLASFRRPRYVLIAAFFCAAVLIASGYVLRCCGSIAVGRVNAVWDDVNEGRWPDGFETASIPSSLDGVKQRLKFYVPAQRDGGGVILVSLHTWSGRYHQYDPLAHVAKEKGWAYIRPDARGHNNHPDACLSDKVIADIDDALDFVKNKLGAENHQQLHVVGVSGGGYTALGMYARSKHRIDSMQTWVPISDLSRWHSESREAGSSYFKDIERCTGSLGRPNKLEMDKRSPINWLEKPQMETKLRVYAGIKDGHTGSVPISHSIDYFNRLVKLAGREESMVSQEQRAWLLTQGRSTNFLGKADNMIDGRSVIYEADTPEVSILLFDGGHEMLPYAAARQLEADVASQSP